MLFRKGEKGGKDLAATNQHAKQRAHPNKVDSNTIVTGIDVEDREARQQTKWREHEGQANPDRQETCSGNLYPASHLRSP